MMRVKTCKPNIEVIYDSECPMCNLFANSIRDVDNVIFVDARQASNLLNQSQNLNLDIDRGAVVYVEGKFLYGAEAFQYVASLVESKGMLGFASRTLFRHRFIAKITYPVLVFIRKQLLKLLGRPLINASKN